jgi:hypothetical protein
MASTFAKTEETVMGSWRVMRGTLTCTDGAAGDDADSGFNRVIALFSPALVGLTHTAGGGKINALTAASGATVDVIVFGL